MCLIINLRPRAKRARLDGLPATPLVTTAAHGALRISEDGTCSCSLLTDDADWNAEYWDLLPKLRGPLAETVRRVGGRMPEGFTLEALWAGDSYTSECECRLKDLVDAISNNRLGTHVRYTVSP